MAICTRLPRLASSTVDGRATPACSPARRPGATRAYPTKRPNTTQALCPPKPNEFDVSRAPATCVHARVVASRCKAGVFAHEARCRECAGRPARRPVRPRRSASRPPPWRDPALWSEPRRPCLPPRRQERDPRARHSTEAAGGRPPAGAPTSSIAKQFGHSAERGSVERCGRALSGTSRSSPLREGRRTP